MDEIPYQLMYILYEVWLPKVGLFHQKSTCLICFKNLDIHNLVESCKVGGLIGRGGAGTKEAPFDRWQFTGDSVVLLGFNSDFWSFLWDSSPLNHHFGNMLFTFSTHFSSKVRITLVSKLSEITMITPKWSYSSPTHCGLSENIVQYIYSRFYLGGSTNERTSQLSDQRKLATTLF